MPYILNTEKDIEEMLEAIGVNSVEDLYSHLPSEIRLKEPLNLPQGLSEMEVKKVVEAISKKNLPLDSFNSFLGAGCYDHYIPSALKFIISQSEFLTAYTPYQPECSQGILQAIYEYQSYICLLTGMDVSNASLFDGASSLAEAVLMSLRVKKRKKVIVSQAIHPEYRETLRTYLSGFNYEIEEVGFDKNGFVDVNILREIIDEDSACFAFQSPNFFGLIEDGKTFSSIVKEKQALMIMITNPLSLAILKEPSLLGVDITCGDGQVLGGSLNFGGPSLGFLAAKKDYLRQMPGRIVGKTQDSQGKSAYCLTSQTREQHIRREKATSNICSNQSLNAIGASVYLSLMGKEGFKEAAIHSLNLTHYLHQRLGEIDEIKLPFSSCFFNEFLWQVKDAKRLVDKLYKKKIIAGFCLAEVYPQFPNAILSCCTEKKSKEDVDSFIESLKALLHNNTSA
ncbi:MAG: aminomethyl-transferring glycine dehydrogenase subunit GcvPA [Candidatus Omnitrophota bacterium]